VRLTATIGDPSFRDAGRAGEYRERGTRAKGVLMEGPKTPPSRPVRPKSKTPAERAEEFTATQRRLKEEASARREAARRDSARRKT
jgi:hypothetical protein